MSGVCFHSTRSLYPWFQKLLDCTVTATYLRLLPVLGFLIIYRSCHTTRLCFLLAANSCFRFAVSLWTCLSSLIRLFFFELLCFYEAGTSRREFCDLFGDHALCIKPSVCLRSLTGLTHIFNRLGTSTLDYTVKICRFAIEQSSRSLRWPLATLRICIPAHKAYHRHLPLEVIS